METDTKSPLLPVFSAEDIKNGLFELWIKSRDGKAWKESKPCPIVKRMAEIERARRRRNEKKYEKI